MTGERDEAKLRPSKGDKPLSGVDHISSGYQPLDQAGELSFSAFCKAIYQIHLFTCTWRNIQLYIAVL